MMLLLLLPLCFGLPPLLSLLLPLLLLLLTSLPNGVRWPSPSERLKGTTRHSTSLLKSEPGDPAMHSGLLSPVRDPLTAPTMYLPPLAGVAPAAEGSWREEGRVGEWVGKGNVAPKVPVGPREGLRALRSMACRQAWRQAWREGWKKGKRRKGRKGRGRAGGGWKKVRGNA